MKNSHLIIPLLTGFDIYYVYLQYIILTSLLTLHIFCTSVCTYFKICMELKHRYWCCIFLHQTLPYFKFAPPVASTSLSLLLAFAKGSPADVKLPFVCFMQINKCKRRLLLLVLHNESIWGKKVQKCCCPYCPLKCFENVWVAKPKNF